MNTTYNSKKITPDPKKSEQSLDATLIVNEVSKAYKNKTRGHDDNITILDRVSFTANPGEFVTIIGPSGCGKSTLLNAIAGLTEYQGQIKFGGIDLSGPGPERSVVFQNATLLPWRTVKENVSYGLQLRRVFSKSEIDHRVNYALERVGLNGFGNYYPHQISGGMQQRANIARALVVEPKIVLMDEPFGALDALTRETLQDQLFDFLGRDSSTTIFITHDIEEAVYLSDKILVMSAGPGQIIQEFEVDFHRPRSRAIYELSQFDDLVRNIRNLLRPGTGFGRPGESTV